MKHGLKQEIKRGLSVLMAVSMVASSALPVMAEEVVEEAVEVETVSEEVADEAEDVVVDVAEDAEVVEEVIDGETLEVITEEAGEGVVCEHPREKLTVKPMWETNALGELKMTDMKFSVSCSCGADLGADSIKIVSPSERPSAPTAPTASGHPWRYTKVVLQTGDSCKKPEITAIKVYEDYTTREGKYEPFVYEYTETKLNTQHDFTDATNLTIVKEATCTDYGVLKNTCKRCSESIELKKGEYDSLVTEGSNLGKKVYAQGHKYIADIRNVTWTDNYKKAWLKMTCETCKHTIDVNVTQYVKMYSNKNLTDEITADDIVTGCDTATTIYYAIDATNAQIEALANKADGIDATKQHACQTINMSRFNKENGNYGVIYKTDYTVPTVVANNTGVVFAWDGSALKNGVPVISATIKCDTCTTEANKKLDNYETHTYYSNVDYTKGDNKKSFPVEVQVIKGATTKDTMCGAGRKETTEYTAVLKLNGKTYECSGYKCTQNGNENTNHKWVTEKTIPGSNHSFSGKLTNENAIQNDPTKPLVKATCTKEGSGYFTCKDCGQTFFAIIPALPHKFIDKKVDEKATCAKDTTYTAYCDVCNKLYSYANVSVNQYVDADTYANRAKDYRDWPNQVSGVPAGFDFDTVEKFRSACEDVAAVYDELDKAAKKELTDEKSAGHKYEVNEKEIASVWSADYSEVIVTFKCSGSDHLSDSALHVYGVTAHTPDTKKVKAISKLVTEVKPGYDTKGKGHYEAVATFTDDQGKEWTYTAVSKTVELPATGKQETATVSLTGKTVVTYNGDRQHLTATTNSDVKPVVSYYKDAALTKKFSGAPYTAGTYYVKATVAESKKYTAAESEVVKLVIKKADPKVTISWKPDKKDATKANITVKQKNIGGQQGKVTYKAKNAKIEVNSKGVVTFTNKAKKGTNYKVVVKVKATTNYNGYTKTIKVNY